jgi:uncharacterized protein (TIGR02271 family)
LVKKKDKKGKYNQGKEVDTEFAEDASLQLHEEELDIAKDRVRTGEVTLHKDIVEEHKAVDVPVTHEEVIVERKALDHRHSDSPIGKEETIHIPVSEERVEAGKHTEITGEVTAHKKPFKEMKHVDQKLKKEVADVDVDGNPKTISKNKDKSDR